MWAKFDDHFDDDPDGDIVGGMGICLFICAITWASRNLTDGFVPAARIPKLAGGGDPDAMTGLTDARTRWLVPVEGGYQIRSYLKYNKSKQQVLEDRQKEAQRQRDWQERKRQEPEQEPEQEAREQEAREQEKRDLSLFAAPTKNNTTKNNTTEGPAEEPAFSAPEETPEGTDAPHAIPANNSPNTVSNTVANTDITPLGTALKTAPPESRIPSPESRVPEPNQPPYPPPEKADPPPGWEGGLDGWLSEINFLGTDPVQAEALLCRFGTEDVRWQVRALLWRQSQGHAIPNPWGYLVKLLRDKRPLPQAIALARDGPKHGGKAAEKRTAETPKEAEARLAEFQRGARGFAASRPKCLSLRPAPRR